MWKNVFGFGTVGLGHQRPSLFPLFSFPNWRINCGFGLVNAFVLKVNIMKTVMANLKPIFYLKSARV